MYAQILSLSRRFWRISTFVPRTRTAQRRSGPAGNLKEGTLASLLMRFRTLALGVASLCAMLSASFLGAQEDSIEWFNNYKHAVEAAKRTGKPIFLEYRCEP